MRSLLDRLAGLFLGLDLLQGVPVGEVDAALLVDIGDLDPDHVANIDHVLYLLHPALRQLGDVQLAPRRDGGGEDGLLQQFIDDVGDLGKGILLLGRCDVLCGESAAVPLPVRPSYSAI